MITGFNSEVSYNDIVFHIQTEDRGVKAGRIDTIIYRSGGAIVHRKQIFYKDILGAECMNTAIEEIMREIHEKTINEVRKGLWTIGATIVPKRSFREVITGILIGETSAPGVD